MDQSQSYLRMVRRAIDTHFRPLIGAVLLLGGYALTASSPAVASKTFTAFESGQVRPLAISPDGNRLYAVNTPDNRLEIFGISTGQLNFLASVPVGMEPVAVAAPTNTEVWVVNHLSDSVSIVAVANPGRAHVVRTLYVGDEPRDIVFAGPDGKRAFIAAANRDLRRAPGSNIGNLDVWVFDSDNLGSDLGGTPLTVINAFADVPRALAVSPDGNLVYAATFHSGNKTTAIPAKQIDGDLPPPLSNQDGDPAPPTSLIVQNDGQEWRDHTGRILSDKVRIDLPDLDVHVIDAAAATPNLTTSISGVGTILFNMTVNPQTGAVYVSNTEARNLIRFEGAGSFGGSTVRGHISESRITVIDTDGNVSPRHLNKHINYNSFPGTAEENAKALAFPLEMAITADGSTLYVTALGSSKIGVLDIAELEDNTFEPSLADQITVSGGGPTGIVLDEARDVGYVLTRFDNSISQIDLTSGVETQHVAMFNPEPASIVEGRPFLYDASYTSSRGDAACASCHIFGDVDSLAWDLGDPEGTTFQSPNPFRHQDPSVVLDLHPMKGPMTTQSFRGMANHGPMHWRGDRTGAVDPGGDALDEDAAFKKFNPAFVGLIGRTEQLTEAEMQAFTDFVLQIMYPPNPNRAIDNSLTPAQAAGRDVYMNVELVLELPEGGTCNTCHVVDPVAGFFGSDGLSSTRAEHPGSPIMKVPHLRNLYTKISTPESDEIAQGPMIRGFFTGHDGTGIKLINFLQSPQFDFPGGDPQRRQVIEFLRAMDTNLAPAVAQQVTLNAGNAAAANQRIDILAARAAVTQPLEECDLTVSGVVNGIKRGWLMLPNGRFISDRPFERLYTLAQLKTIGTAVGQELTFTCVPPGNGERIALDRDEDGFYDGVERILGTNPADASSYPGA